MDPTSWISKLDQAVKPIVIFMAAAAVCIGFFVGKIMAADFMPFVYLVVGAAFGRTMMGGMSAFTKTTETSPDGTKKETMQAAPPVAPVIPTPVTTPPINGGTT